VDGIPPVALQSRGVRAVAMTNAECGKNQRGRCPSLDGEAPSSKVGRAWYGQICRSLAPDAARTRNSQFSQLLRRVPLLPYGRGTLITVLTMVTDAWSATALPFSVVTGGVPAVENETAAEAIMVPTMVPPPEGLIVAALPTCQ